MPGPTWNLADLFEIVVDAVPDREALVCGSRRLTYDDLDRRANRLAHWLTGQGVGPGDHVGVHLWNSTEYLETMLAAFKLRAVPINVNYRYVEDELRYLLLDAEVSTLVFHRSLAPVVHAVRGDLPRLRSALAVDDGSDVDDSGVEGRGTTDYEAALASSSPERGFGPRSADDLYILYTGGTTGMPKGVMWRHEDIFFGALGGGNPGGHPARDPHDLAISAPRGRTRSLPASPFMHGTAHWMAFTALYAGGTVIVSPDRHFDADALWRLVSDERASFLTIVGDAFGRPLVDALRRLPPGVDPSSCRVIVSGGAVFSPSVKRALADLLPGTLVVDTYGSSETGGQGRVVTAAGADTNPSRFTVNDETVVVDDDLRPISEPGAIGRLARRGHVPLGYFHDPERTAATFPVVDGIRWAVSGDYAAIESDGSITLLGRGSVSINTGGEKVFPEEVEAVLKGLEAVFDAVVVGVPDERWGERVVAVVQPRSPERPPTLGQLDAFMRGAVADYKVPRALVLVDEVQRAPTGKADYRWARHVVDHRLGLTTNS